LDREDQIIYDAETSRVEEETASGITTPQPTETVKEINPVDALKQKIKDIISGNEYLTEYFGVDTEELSRKNPGKENVERYQQLLGQVNSTIEPNLQNIINRKSDYYSKRKIELGLSVSEIDEFKNLNQLLNDWKTLNSSPDGQNSVASLLEMIEKLNAQIVKSETKTSFDDKDLRTIFDASEINAKKEEGTTRGLQTPTNALATFDKDNVVFNHISISTFASFFPGAQLSLDNQISPISEAEFKKISKKEGTAFTLNIDGEPLSLRINNRAGIVVNRRRFEELQSQSNVIIKQWGKGVSAPVYQLVGDIYVPLRSDFNYASVNPNDNWTVNETAVNEVKNGDNMDLFVSLDDAFNADLLQNTDNLTKEQKQNQINNLHIYVMKNGTQELLASLPATPKTDSDAEIGRELQQLRKSAYKQALKARGKGQKLIKLNEKVESVISFLGSPNLEMQNNDGIAEIKNIPFNEQSISQVEGTGYITGTNVTANTQVDDIQFIERLAKLNPTERIPFIVFTQAGRKIAFPVTLTQTTIDKSGDITNILNSNISSNEKGNALIDALLESGYTPTEYKIDYSSEDWIYSAETQRAVDDLSRVISFADVTEFAQKSYNRSNLLLDATIAIDLTNKPLQTNKILFKVSDRLNSDPISLEEQAESAEEQKIRMVDELNQEAENLYNDYLTNPAYQNILSGSVVDTFDDTPIEPATTYLEKLRNINTFRQALSGTIAGKQKQIIGDKNLKELREMLRQYDEFKGKENLIKVQIKNQKLQKEVAETKEDC